MPDTFEEFNQIIAGDPASQARFEQATAEAQHAARDLGAEISIEEATELHSVRIAALSDGYIDHDILGRELSNLPAVKAVKRQAAIRAEIAEGKTDGIAAAIENLTPAARMEWGRKNLPADPDAGANGPQKLTAEEEARVIASLEGLPAHHRMTVARRFGLGV